MAASRLRTSGTTYQVVSTVSPIAAAAAARGRRPEEEVRDHVHGDEDPEPEKRGAREEQDVTDRDDVALAALVPAQAVVDGRRHEQDRPHRGQQEADEQRNPVAVLDLAEAGGERDREQEREQHLRAREHHPELIQELDQLPVGSLLRRLAAGRAAG